MLGNLNKYQALKVISLSSLPNRRSTYFRVPNKRAGRLLKDEKNPSYLHLFGTKISTYSFIPTYIFIRFCIFSLAHIYYLELICTMAFPVVEFSREGYKIRKVFGSKSTVFKWNYQFLKIGVMGSCQKVPKFDFQSQFSMSKIIGIFLIFFSFKNIN